MKHISLFCLFIYFSVCNGQGLIGSFELDDLKKEPYSEWFTPEYDGYSPFAKTVEQLTSKIEGVEIVVFMGTWCSDSQMQVPAFFRVLDEVKHTGKVSLIAVDRDKKTPSGSAAENGITNVPTFIFYKNGTEINRIVESPIDFLEDDMLAILSGAAYKHTYED